MYRFGRWRRRSSTVVMPRVARRLARVAPTPDRLATGAWGSRGRDGELDGCAGDALESVDGGMRADGAAALVGTGELLESRSRASRASTAVCERSDSSCSP